MNSPENKLNLKLNFDNLILNDDNNNFATTSNNNNNNIED